MAQRLALVTGFDDLLALDAIGFTPFDYQIRAARTALRRFRGRGLLSDEVGLGKTIEAGLVLKEYLLRQMVQRVLILTPPGLVEQWREELATKFDILDFVTSNDEAFRTLGADAWTAFPRVIASLATARRPEHRQVITAELYDLVIVDEAHHLKNRTSVSWKLVNELQKRYILLLTATPVQNSLDELYNLVTVLKPGQLKSPKEFQREFVVRGDPRLPKNRGRAARAAERCDGAPFPQPDQPATAPAPRPHRPTGALRRRAAVSTTLSPPSSRRMLSDPE